MLVITELGWLLNPFLLFDRSVHSPTLRRPFPFYSPRDMLLYSFLTRVIARVTLFFLFLFLSSVLFCLSLCLDPIISQLLSSLCFVPG